MIDYYEFLQISPNADIDTIHRVYRFLAARFHPDNASTGDAERFRLLRTAYEVLSDRIRRAEYDTARNALAPEPFSNSVDFMDSLAGELNRRLAVLAVLYQRRRANSEFPEVTLAEIEERMGFPRDYLDFTLWYLLRKSYISKSDSGQYALTVDGADFVEAQRAGLPTLSKMLCAGLQPSAEEVETANRLEERAGTPVARTAPLEASSNAAQLASERRRGLEDRRMGAPDFRIIKTERRGGRGDRRGQRNG